MDVSNARQIAARAAAFGAAVGGALFGIGMIRARGCSSRLLVLAAQGNLRSVLSAWCSRWRRRPPGRARSRPGASTFRRGGRSKAAPRATSSPVITGIAPARCCSARCGWPPRCCGRGASVSRPGAGRGRASSALAIAAAWWFTATVVATSMETGLAPIQALSFTGPSAEVLTRVLFAPDKPPTFDLSLVPGVFLGAFVAAALFRRAQARRLQRRRLDAALPDRRAADGLRRHDGRRLRSRRGLSGAVFTSPRGLRSARCGRARRSPTGCRPAGAGPAAQPPRRPASCRPAAPSPEPALDDASIAGACALVSPSPSRPLSASPAAARGRTRPTRPRRRDRLRRFIRHGSRRRELEPGVPRAWPAECGLRRAPAGRLPRQAARATTMQPMVEDLVAAGCGTGHGSRVGRRARMRSPTRARAGGPLRLQPAPLRRRRLPPATARRPRRRPPAAAGRASTRSPRTRSRPSARARAHQRQRGDARHRLKLSELELKAVASYISGLK